MMNLYAEKKKSVRKRILAFPFLKLTMYFYMNGQSVFSILLLTTLVVTVVTI